MSEEWSWVCLLCEVTEVGFRLDWTGLDKEKMEKSGSNHALTIRDLWHTHLHVAKYRTITVSESRSQGHLGYPIYWNETIGEPSRTLRTVNRICNIKQLLHAFPYSFEPSEYSPDNHNQDCMTAWDKILSKASILLQINSSDT